MGFSPRTETLLTRANVICEGRGVRLTDLRRQVLGLILDREAPTGAYDLLDQLRSTRHGAAPPTVYRALEFLQEQGLVHKLERLSAFVGCIADEDHNHAAQFFICRSCGRVTELEDHELAQALQDAATPDQAKVDELGNQLIWQTRIFEDRRRVIKFVCEVPTAIDQRLFALGRVIRQEME